MASCKTRLVTNTSTVLLFAIFFVLMVSSSRKCSEFGPRALMRLGQCQSDCVANAAALVVECARYPHSNGHNRVTTGSSSPCVIRGCTKNEGYFHNHNKHGKKQTKCNTVRGVTIKCHGNTHHDNGCRSGQCEEGVTGLCHQEPNPLIHVTLANDNGPGAAGNVCSRVNRANRAYTFDRWLICGASLDPLLFPLEWTAACTGVARAVDGNYGEDYHQLRIHDDDDNYVDAYAEENDVSFNEYKTFANMLRLEREQSYWRGYEHGVIAQEHPPAQKRYLSQND